MRKQILAIAAGALFLSGTAMAQTKAKKKVAPKAEATAPAAPAEPSSAPDKPAPVAQAFSHQGQGYGMGGCGIGGMLIGNKPGIVQVFAVTLNGSFSSQTWGISSGTSGCAKGAGMASMYIENNREALAREAARGQGETLAGLSRLMGCADDSAFGSEVQKRYSETFGEGVKNADAIRGDLETLVKTVPSCKVSA